MREKSILIVIAFLFLFTVTACSSTKQTAASVSTPQTEDNTAISTVSTANIEPQSSINDTNNPSPWVKRKSMPVKLLTQRAAVINERIYILGTMDQFADHNDLYEFDPTNDIWTKKSPTLEGKGTVISGGGVAVLNGKLYTFGGGILKSDESFEKTFNVQEYDPATDKWTLKGELPDNNYAFGAAAVNDRIYIVGGESSALYEFDPEANTWVSKTPPPLYYQDAGIAAFSGRIYAISGAGTNFVSEYDPKTDEWTIKSPIPTNRIHLFPVTTGNMIYAINGILMPEMRHSNNVEAYDPKQDQWTQKGAAPVATYCSATAEVNGKIYIIGGNLDGDHAGPIFDVYEYDPAMEQ